MLRPRTLPRQDGLGRGSQGHADGRPPAEGLASPTEVWSQAGGSRGALDFQSCSRCKLKHVCFFPSPVVLLS